MKVRHIEHASSLRLDPSLLGQRLTLGTVTVAARVVRRVLVSARGALIEVPAERGRTARLDVGQDAALPGAESRDRFELRSVGTNDVRKVEADGCPCGGSHAVSAFGATGPGGLESRGRASASRVRSEPCSKGSCGLKARVRRARRCPRRAGASQTSGVGYAA